MDDDLQQTPPEPPAQMPPPPAIPPAEVRGLSSTGRAGPGAPARPATGRGRTGGLLMVIGGGIVLLSVFLPRFTVTSPGGTGSLGGIQGAGIGMLLLAGFAIAKGLQELRPDAIGTRFGSPLLTGILMVVSLAIRWSDLQNGLASARDVPGVSASIGPGFWLSVIGTLSVLAGGALLQFGDRAA